MNDSDSESDSEEIHCTASYREGGRVCGCGVCGRRGGGALVEIARMLDLKYVQSSDASRMSRVECHATTYSY